MSSKEINESLMEHQEICVKHIVQVDVEILERELMALQILDATHT